MRARNLSRATALADRLEVADSLWARFMGLMGRPGLEPGSGPVADRQRHPHDVHALPDRRRLPRPSPTRRAGGAKPVLSVHPGLRAWTGLVPLVRGAHGVLELPVGTIERSRTAVGDSIVLGPAPG